MNNDKFEPGPLADVEYRTNGTRSTLVFVRELHHPPAKVWAALTDPALLRQWSPFVSDRDLGHVGEAELTMIDGQDTTLRAKVLQSDPPKVLEYTWGDDVLCWQLEGTEQGTRLTLHHTTDDPTMGPKAAAGWHICLVVAERLLDARPIGPIVGEDAMNYGWQELYDAYAKAQPAPKS